MIVTLTPNPSLDRTVSITDLHRGEVQRATTSRLDPGGKGVNISRALTAHQARTLAVLPAGGPQGHLLAELLQEAGIVVAIVPISGSIRANLALVEPDGTTTKINEAGPHLSGAEFEALLAGAVDTLAEQPTWLVGSGSLPPGVDDDLYAGLVRRCRDAGVRVAIDSSGAPLAAAIAAGPDLIKPNLEELEELVGRSLDTLADVLGAALDLVGHGVAAVVVSLGGQGALLVSSAVIAHAVAPVSAPLSTVGAGDALLAGYLYATSSGSTAAQALSAGVAWGAAAVGLPGSRMPSPADVAGIHVSITTEPDLTLHLKHRSPPPLRNRAMSLITENLEVLNLDSADRHAATRVLAQALAGEGRVTDLDGFLADIRKREEQMPTGLPGGIGIPPRAAPTSPSRRWPSAAREAESTGAPRTAPPRSSS